MAAMRREDAVAELTRPGAPFELVETEVGGIAVRTYAAAPPTLRGVLEASRAHATRDFLVYEDDRFTFADHLGIVAGLARWFADERGIGPGDRVAIGMRNFPEWLMAFWATEVLGAVAVPLNAWWTGPELRFALEDSGTALAVLDGERHDRLVDDLGELRLPSVVVRHRGDLRGRAVHWREVFEGLDRSADLPATPVGPDDDATILYTSGTTGRPKGAVGTHRNHVHNYLNMAFSSAVDRVLAASAGRGRAAPPAAPPVPCSLQTYPFFHIGGITTIYTSTGFGVKMVLQYKWDLEEALALIERERVTSLAAVPLILRRFLDSPLLEGRDLSSLATLGSGGAPVPPDLIPRIDDQFASRGGAVERLRPHRDDVGGDVEPGPRLRRPAEQRGPHARHDRRPGGRSRDAAPTSRRDRPASCGSAARPSCAATGTSPKRRRGPSPTAGSTAATSAPSTRRGSCTSSTASRTS